MGGAEWCWDDCCVVGGEVGGEVGLCDDMSVSREALLAKG